MHYVYVLQNQEEELYYGSTNDLRRRLTDHNNGRSLSTKGHQWKLIYYEAYLAESDARRREHQIKRHGQAKSKLKGRISDSLKNKS